MMTDVRQQVEEDRGLLKKIQLVIPGFRGYRKREDIRAADSILRLQMADGLVKVREGLEEARRAMTEDYQTKNIDQVGRAISKSRTLEGKVRHAEQGYSGFSPAVRISMPASSWWRSHSTAARSLARTSSSPDKRQAGQSFSVSARYSGLGKLPTVVVSSMVCLLPQLS